jgi:hypothetical protein
MNGSPATALVRAWVDLYTRGLPEPIRAARRDEVDDDLWCQAEEATAIGRSARSLDTEVLLRLLFGMPSDVSWRLSSGEPAGGPSFPRHPSRGARVLGILAIAGALGWGIAVTAMALVGVEVWSGPMALAILIATFGGQLAFAGAAIGLALRFQDRLTPVGALAGVIGGLGPLFGAFGAYQASMLLPIGSSILAWDLGRSGVLSRGLGITHAASALVVVPLFVILLANYSDETANSGLLLLVVPYLVTWVVIGLSLIRGVPSVKERTPSVEHRRTRDG